MPQPTRSLTLSRAVDLTIRWSFPEGTGEQVGLEVEWLTSSTGGGDRSVSDLRSLAHAAEPLPAGSRITFEPGGQLEVSTPPLPGPADAIAAARADADVVRRVLSEHGVETTGLGMDPARPTALRTDEPRYVAMRAYFDEGGPDGGHMMCGTAAVQVNVDAGADDEGLGRWRIANLLGPTLVAAFANSPWQGCRSARMAAWLAIDPTRTAPVAFDGPDPVRSWAAYTLDARVMVIRIPDGYVPVTEPIPFKRWIAEGHPLGFPTSDDLAYHLTTLFPPVRPRGWLEIRMIDMPGDEWWPVPAAVTHALLTDPHARAEAERACEGTAGLWHEAARFATEHPALARSARRCFAAAVGALERGGADPLTVDLVRAYADRYVAAGRCPADEQLAGAGTVHPDRTEAL